MTAAYLKVPPAPTAPSRWWCDGKARFESALLAQAIVDRKRKKSRNHGIYRCYSCGCWHIGNNSHEKPKVKAT